MTDLAVTSAADEGSTPTSRLAPPVRIVLLVLASMGLFLCAGMVVGIAVAATEDGGLKWRGAALLGGALLGVALFGWACWRLLAHWRRPGRSAYERRYSTVMAVLFASGLPVGLLIGMAGDGQPQSSLFSNAPLDPGLAGIAAVALVLLLGGGLVLYHRAIDDHEQQAYLWANSLAFYFLAITLPVAWLLARGGLLPALGIGSAMLILLAAFVINFTVWAWLKFR